MEAIDPKEIPAGIKLMASRLNKLDQWIDEQIKEDEKFTLQEIMEVLLLKARHLCFSYDQSGSFMHCLGWMNLVLNSRAPEYYELTQQFNRKECPQCPNKQNGEQSTSESTCSKATESNPSQDTTNSSASTETCS
jgi:hypothetical protein